MKNEKGITLTSLMVYITAMAMIILTITNITRYFYANVTHTENTTKYAEDYLAFLECITEEINQKDNIILQCNEENEIDDEYVIFSKTYNQYTFKDDAIYKNQKKICENVKVCEFAKSADNTQLTISIQMKDRKTYTTTFTIRKY